MDSTPVWPTDRPALDPLMPPPPNDMEIALGPNNCDAGSDRRTARLGPRQTGTGGST